MHPSFSVLDSAYGGLRNAKLISNHFLKSRVSQNQINLLFRKLRKAVSLPGLPCSMKEFVGVISLACVPAKIARPAISTITVVMRALHSIWSRTKKCFGNKQVNIGAAPNSVGGKIDAQVATLANVGREQLAANSSCSPAPSIAYPAFASYPSKAADGKQTIKTYHGAPFFMNIYHALNYTITNHQQQHVFMKGGY